jgi:hypothetical protein
MSCAKIYREHDRTIAACRIIYSKQIIIVWHGGNNVGRHAEGTGLRIQTHLTLLQTCPSPVFSPRRGEERKTPSPYWGEGWGEGDSVGMNHCSFALIAEAAITRACRECTVWRNYRFFCDMIMPMVARHEIHCDFAGHWRRVFYRNGVVVAGSGSDGKAGEREWGRWSRFFHGRAYANIRQSRCPGK